MTPVQDLPVRWCPNPLCGASSTIPEYEWVAIELTVRVAALEGRGRSAAEVVCANCCRPFTSWLKARPR